LGTESIALFGFAKRYQFVFLVFQKVLEMKLRE
jgi:hypothetical protein